MTTDCLIVDPVHPDAAVIERAAACLRAGGLVAFPTETVYGLGAHALDTAAVQRLFHAKGRPSHDPVIVHVARTEDLGPIVMTPPLQVLTARFWPGPLTLVVMRGPGVPDEVTAGGPTVAIRIPAHPVAQALLRAAGIPVAAPSANLFSRPSPTAAQHVLDDLRGRVDLVLDGGSTPVGVESTVLDLTTLPPVILRPGAVSLEMLREVVPDIIMGVSRAGEALRSPGLLSRHYSPRAPLILYRGPGDRVLMALLEDGRQAQAGGQQVGVMAHTEDVRSFDGSGIRVADLGPSSDPAFTARRLYAALRELDAAGVDVILAADIADGEGLGAAIGDRLRRAATGEFRTV